MNVGIGKAFTGAFVASVALVLALTARHEALGTFKTQNLVVDSTATVGPAASTSGHAIVNGDITLETGTGQAALFITPRAASADGLNICIGGGCQLVAFDGMNTQTGSRNIALGINNLNADTTGFQNVAIGPDVLTLNTTGHDNVGVGEDALHSNTTGFESVAVGPLALSSQTGGSSNTAIGGSALQFMTTAGANTAVGATAMQNLVTGDFNVAVGDQALAESTNTMRNVAIGANALLTLTTGWGNTAIGWSADQLMTTGLANTAVGYFALQSNTTGGGNTAVGGTVGADLTTGTFNVMLGGITGGGITTGSFNTIVGAQVGALAAATTSKIILADGTGTAIDQIWFSPVAPTSVDHGTLGAGSTNSVGNVTAIGANNSVTLTYSNGGFPNHSWCHAQPNDHSVSAQYIEVTNSTTAPVFNCFAIATQSAANCDPFTYWCTGQ